MSGRRMICRKICQDNKRRRLDLMFEELKNYNCLNPQQKLYFVAILKKFLDAQGTEEREKMKILSVEVSKKRVFRIDLTRDGRPGYQYLDPKKGEWY